jgi:hypothetical protein
MGHCHPNSAGMCRDRGAEILPLTTAHSLAFSCIFKRLALLKSLNLSWNSFQGSVPSEFETFRHLVDLFLNNNNFSGSLPGVIKVMNKLENIVVSFNAFTGELPTGMEHMISLSKFVFLSLACWLRGSSQVARCCALFAPATFHLDENRLNGTLPSALGACAMLRDLKLEYNDFSGNIPTQLGLLQGLRK